MVAGSQWLLGFCGETVNSIGDGDGNKNVTIKKKDFAL